MRRDEGGRRQALQERIDCNDEDAAGESRQRGERREPLRGDVRVGREHVVGQRLVVRQRHDRQGGIGEEAELAREALGVAGGGADGEDGTRAAACQLDAGEGERGAIELAPTDDPMAIVRTQGIKDGFRLHLRTDSTQ